MTVTFDETPPSVVSDYRPQGGTLVGFLLRHHMARTITEAQIILLVVALALFIVAGILIVRSLRDDTIDTRRNFEDALPTR